MFDGEQSIEAMCLMIQTSPGVKDAKYSSSVT
jgi:hypothetical protein